MKVVFLGTGGSFPTKERGVTSIALKRKGELLLFDCGEGTQRQMAKAGVSLMNIDMVFITHFHGDHFLGLPGMVQTMNLMDRDEDLNIYGPEGTSERVDKLLDVPVYTKKFDIKTIELEPGDVVEKEEYFIKTAKPDHSANGLAYSLEEKERPGKFYPEKAKELGLQPGPKYSRLQQGETVELEDGTIIEPEQVVGPKRPGRKITYSGDTAPCEEIEELAEGSDVLIHEATFSHELVEEAEEAQHSTTKQAAEIAKKANVEKLFLTHSSPRYRDLEDLEEEAREVFSKVKMAEDLEVVDIELK